MDSCVSEKIKVVIWGASGHAAEIANVLGYNSAYDLIGFIDNINHNRKGELFCGKKILGGKEQLSYLEDHNIKHIALGFGNCAARTKLSDFLIRENFSLLNIYHPKSIIENNTGVGRATVILAGAYIGPYCKIGDHCIINNNSTVSHNSSIGSSVHIYPGIHISGIANIVQEELEC